MINPVNDLYRIPYKEPQIRTVDKEKKTTEKPFYSSPASDSVDLQPEFLLNSIRTQIDNLKTELPGIITDALLAPGNDEAIRKSPITALIFRLDSPLQSHLGKADKLSKDQILGLREEIQKFKDEIPAFNQHALLAPLLNDSDQVVALDEILSGLASRLDGIINTLNQSISV